jgi:hypothetical protein
MKIERMDGFGRTTALGATDSGQHGLEDFSPQNQQCGQCSDAGSPEPAIMARLQGTWDRAKMNEFVGDPPASPSNLSLGKRLNTSLTFCARDEALAVSPFPSRAAQDAGTPVQYRVRESHSHLGLYAGEQRFEGC